MAAEGPPKRPGRPRIDAGDLSVPVHLTLTAREYDLIWHRARAERVTIQEQIRRDLRIAQQKKNAK